MFPCIQEIILSKILERTLSKILEKMLPKIVAIIFDRVLERISSKYNGGIPSRILEGTFPDIWIEFRENPYRFRKGPIPDTRKNYFLDSIEHFTQVYGEHSFQNTRKTSFQDCRENLFQDSEENPVQKLNGIPRKVKWNPQESGVNAPRLVDKISTSFWRESLQASGKIPL